MALRHAVVPASPRQLIGPPDVGQSGIQVVQVGLSDVDTEGGQLAVLGHEPTLDKQQVRSCPLLWSFSNPCSQNPLLRAAVCCKVFAGLQALDRTKIGQRWFSSGSVIGRRPGTDCRSDRFSDTTQSSASTDQEPATCPMSRPTSGSGW